MKSTRKSEAVEIPRGILDGEAKLLASNEHTLAKFAVAYRDSATSSIDATTIGTVSTARDFANYALALQACQQTRRGLEHGRPQHDVPSIARASMDHVRALTAKGAIDDTAIQGVRALPTIVGNVDWRINVVVQSRCVPSTVHTYACAVTCTHVWCRLRN
jgi:hypothetical protein